MSSLASPGVPFQRKGGTEQGDLCHAGYPCDQGHFSLLRAPLTFLYFIVRSRPGPSRVVFFLVMLNSARKELGRIGILLIPPVYGQQRGPPMGQATPSVTQQLWSGTVALLSLPME